MYHIWSMRSLSSPAIAAGQRVGVEIIAGKIAAILVDAGEEELGIDVRDFIEIEVHAGAESAEVGRVVRLAAGDVGEEVANVVEVEFYAFLFEPGALAAPVAEHVFLVPETLGLLADGGLPHRRRRHFVARAGGDGDERAEEKGGQEVDETKARTGRGRVIHAGVGG